MPPTARAIRPSDVPQVFDLIYPEFRYSESKLTSLFENPDLTRWTAEPLPAGFVLEDGGEIVGYLDSIPREIFLNQTPLKGVIRGSLYVREEYRVHLSTLLFAMTDQAWCDLFLVNSSNAHSGPVNRALRFKQGPASCAGVRYRVFSHTGFLAYGLSRSRRLSRIPRPLAALAGALGGAIWFLGKLFRSDPIPPERTGLISRRVTEITDELFGPFWTELLEGNRGLLTSRRPDVLRWTFGEGLRTGRKAIFGRFDGDALRGYIALRTHVTPDGHLRVRVIDWIAAGNDEKILGDLLRDAVLYVKGLKKAVALQISGFPESVQPLIHGYLPSRRAKPNAFFHKTKNREAAGLMADSWFFGPFDGDTARI